MWLLALLYQIRSVLELRSGRGRSKWHGLIGGQSNIPLALMLLLAMLLLIVSVLAAGEIQWGWMLFN